MNLLVIASPNKYHHVIPSNTVITPVIIIGAYAVGTLAAYNNPYDTFRTAIEIHKTIATGCMVISELLSHIKYHITKQTKPNTNHAIAFVKNGDSDDKYLIHSIIDVPLAKANKNEPIT
jgi:hypothetical protein